MGVAITLMVLALAVIILLTTILQQRKEISEGISKMEDGPDLEGEDDTPVETPLPESVREIQEKVAAVRASGGVVTEAQIDKMYEEYEAARKLSENVTVSASESSEDQEP